MSGAPPVPAGIRLRFAPSPNGRLHLGHAYSALLNAALAHRLGGALLLRIEDIDPVRSTPAFVAGIRADLAWLGLAFPEPVLCQSGRLGVYAAALDRLARRGLAYPCFCTRAAVRAAAGPDRDPDGAPLYPGTCRALPEGEAAARIAAGAAHGWRLDMARALAVLPEPGTVAVFEPGGATASRRAEPARWGDALIGRRDVPASYHLAVVLDDAWQGITRVVRGRDLEPATDLHRLLQALLGLPSPGYHHHALVRDAAGDKLAKSRGSPALADLRAAGADAAEIRARLGFGRTLPPTVPPNAAAPDG